MGNRSGLNFVIDVVAFVGFTLLVSTGVILHFLLPPGTGHRLAIWGFGRHAWGEAHFIISLVLLAVLSIHILLHWRWILAVAKGRESERSGGRLILGIVGLIALVTIALAPVLSPITSTEDGKSRDATDFSVGRVRDRRTASFAGELNSFESRERELLLWFG